MKALIAGDDIEVNKWAITWTDADRDVYLPGRIIDFRPGGKVKVKLDDKGKTSFVLLQRHVRRREAGA